MKVLLAKIGLDGHDRGVHVVEDALNDAGIKTHYIGLHKTPEEIVDTAETETVGAIGISSLTGAHLVIFEKVFELMKERGLDIPVFAGGIVPDEDIAKLEDMGVRKIFLPTTELDEIVNYVRFLEEEKLIQQKTKQKILPPIKEGGD